MTNWKNYVGSTLLAALLLQGCGSTEETTATTGTPVDTSAASKAIAANTISTLIDGNDLAVATDTAKLNFSSGAVENATDASDKVKAVIATLVEDGNITQSDADAVLAGTDLNELYLEAYFDKAAADLGLAPSRLAPSRALSLDFITDPIKDGLVDIMDSTVGDAVTGAAFDVVLNSEGVTVFMLDMARDSETMTQIMIDALDADWDLTQKMCPMLQTNTEFGEKFAALTWERKSMADFFFVAVDPRMYGCLTDAMLLSNNDAIHHEDVEHSTNAYMGMLLEEYSTTYFIQPELAINPQNYGSTFKFASLMMDNGANVIYDSTAKTFENHGDANELANEKFFYSLFKTPGTTDAFVAAMGQLDEPTVTMYMDKIFLGDGTYLGGTAAIDYTGEADTVQGYLNIISIGSAMYDGIYGTKDLNDNRSGAYGFGAYTDAFIGFAGLIPTDRYFTYGKAFMNAGYQYAGFYGINVWDSAVEGATEGAQALWDNATGAGSETTTAAATAPSRSAGMGVVSSDWVNDIFDIIKQAWSNVSLGDVVSAAMDEERTIIGELNDQASIAYNTFMDGRDAAGVKNYPTEITNPWNVNNDTVYGIHGLIELATQEDIFYAHCGIRSTDYIDGQVAPSCDDGSYTIDSAKAAFTLPPFAEITWSFAYGAAKDGVVAYWNNNVNAKWLADLSTNTYVQQYFYPSEDGLVAAYVPNWMMAIDWLKLPNAVQETNYDSVDLSFDGGYVDVYFVSTRADLVDINGAVPIELVDDSMLAADADGNLADARYVYKIRAVSPEQVAAALAYLQGVGEGLIGLDTDNATQTITE